jgi:hypothetical protein
VGPGMIGVSITSQCVEILETFGGRGGGVECPTIRETFR